MGSSRMMFPSQQHRNRKAESESNGAADSREAYARLSPADRGYLDRLEAEPAIGIFSVEEERARMRSGQTADVSGFAVRSEVYQTSACPVHIIRPLQTSERLPITFYFHGGGWTLGDLKTHTKLVCELALRSQSAVAFIEYPLAPERAYPAPLEGCISAIAEVLNTASSLQLDNTRCGFVGDSSGGNLCVAYALLAKQRGLFLPRTQVLLYPVADASLSLPSHLHFADNPNLGRKTMEWFWNNYVSDPSTREIAPVSPLLAEDEAFAAFPPTLIISCEYDILRDEAEQLAARLVRAGVEVVAVRWLGALHGFVVNEALSGSPAAIACVDLVVQHLTAAYADRP
jgi:acetyl esterase